MSACGSCLHGKYLPSGNPGRPDRVECRRYPQIPVQEYTGRVAGAWPIMNVDDWCGEMKFKGVAAVQVGTWMPATLVSRSDGLKLVGMIDWLAGRVPEGVEMPPAFAQAHHAARRILGVERQK